MPKEIVMPLLGFSMEEGQIMQWLKNEGDPLEKGEPLLVVETDKASLEAESHYRGTLYKILVEEGESAPVGAPIALFLEPGEKPGENIEDIQVQAETEPEGQRTIASPLARKLARENDVDLTGLNGSGFQGRIVAGDVKGNVQTVQDDGLKDTIIPYGGARKAIGDKTQLSKNTAPHYYMSTEIDMEAILAFRKKANEEGNKFSLNHILIKAVALALQKNPKLNSTLTGEAITYHRDINIGFVVATEDGMQIPVIRNAEAKSISIVAAEAQALAERIRQGRMQVTDTQDGTFSISNLGMFGISEFTAIIHQPQTAILAVGAAKDDILKVTLSMDHRVIDGVSGARFLMNLREYMEYPLRMLI